MTKFLAFENLPDMCAILIKDEEHSTLVQKTLFDLGVEWAGAMPKKIRNTDKEVIYLKRHRSGDVSMSFSDRVYYFSVHANSIPVIELKTGFVKSNRLVVEIDGKLYDKSIVLDRLKNIDPLF